MAARQTLRQRVTGLAGTARVVARRTPGADTLFQLPSRQSDTALLTAARAFITETEAAPAISRRSA